MLKISLQISMLNLHCTWQLRNIKVHVLYYFESFHTLHKIPRFHFISSCGCFVETHIFFNKRIIALTSSIFFQLTVYYLLKTEHIGQKGTLQIE